MWGKSLSITSDRLEFYVKELMPPVSVSGVECGSKLRRMSSIPGRDVSIFEVTPPLDKSVSAFLLFKKMFTYGLTCCYENMLFASGI